MRNAKLVFCGRLPTGGALHRLDHDGGAGDGNDPDRGAGLEKLPLRDDVNQRVAKDGLARRAQG